MLNMIIAVLRIGMA